MSEYFNLITDTIDECVNCLVAFGENRFTDISLAAIEHIGKCANYLGDVHDETKPPTVLAAHLTRTGSRPRSTSTHAPSSPKQGSLPSPAAAAAGAAGVTGDKAAVAAADADGMLPCLPVLIVFLDSDFRTDFVIFRKWRGL